MSSFNLKVLIIFFPKTKRSVHVSCIVFTKPHEVYLYKFYLCDLPLILTSESCIFWNPIWLHFAIQHLIADFESDHGVRLDDFDKQQWLVSVPTTWFSLCDVSCDLLLRLTWYWKGKYVLYRIWANLFGLLSICLLVNQYTCAWLENCLELLSHQLYLWLESQTPSGSWSNRANKGLVEVTDEPWVLYLVYWPWYTWVLPHLLLDWLVGIVVPHFLKKK